SDPRSARRARSFAGLAYTSTASTGRSTPNGRRASRGGSPLARATRLAIPPPPPFLRREYLTRLFSSAFYFFLVVARRRTWAGRAACRDPPSTSAIAAPETPAAARSST